MAGIIDLDSSKPLQETLPGQQQVLFISDVGPDVLEQMRADLEFADVKSIALHDRAVGKPITGGADVILARNGAGAPQYLEYILGQGNVCSAAVEHERQRQDAIDEHRHFVDAVLDQGNFVAVCGRRTGRTDSPSRLPSSPWK